jgi:hypothetical protein
MKHLKLNGVAFSVKVHLPFSDVFGRILIKNLIMGNSFNYSKFWVSNIEKILLFLTLYSFGGKMVVQLLTGNEPWHVSNFLPRGWYLCF